MEHSLARVPFLRSLASLPRRPRFHLVLLQLSRGSRALPLKHDYQGRTCRNCDNNSAWDRLEAFVLNKPIPILSMMIRVMKVGVSSHGVHVYPPGPPQQATIWHTVRALFSEAVFQDTSSDE